MGRYSLYPGGNALGLNTMDDNNKGVKTTVTNLQNWEMNKFHDAS